MISISDLTSDNRAEWDEYVQRSASGLPHQWSGWRQVLHDTYGYDTRYLLARQSGRVVGVLPLFIIRSPLTGRRVTTTPGGLCADDDDVAAALIASGREIAQKAKAKRFVIHDSRRAWPEAEFITSQHHVHWLVDLPSDPDLLWKGFKGDIRRQVRVARRQELTTIIDRTGAHLDLFYDVFCRFTHAAGTPVYSHRFLEEVIAAFPGRFSIVTICLQDAPIGGYFQLELGDKVHGMWGASLRDYLKLKPVYLAMWEIMNDAIRRGFRYLDMGRSPAGSGAARFKGQWGGQSHPVYQLVMPLNGAAHRPGLAAQVQTDQRMQWFMRLWPRLPMPLARRIGPLLRRHVPFA